jgi:hypothetical protein
MSLTPLPIEVLAMDRGVHGVHIQATYQISVAARVSMDCGFNEDARRMAERQARHEIWVRIYGEIHAELLARFTKAAQARDRATADALLDVARQIKELDR